MEHPYLFFVKFFELIGLGHFAHANVHVIYMWVVMAILIILGWLAGKNTKLVPEPVQNVFEVLISGLEEFMVDITGEEEDGFFPLLQQFLSLYFSATSLVLSRDSFHPRQV